MKVLEINTTYGYGSTGLITKDIGDLLKKCGDEVRYAYQFGECDSSECFKIGSPFDWKFHALYTRFFGKQGWGSRLSTKKLLKYIDKEKPDIVHLHNLHSNYINLPMFLEYLSKKDIATVVTLHDCWYFTGKCYHFAHIECEKWKKKCGNCPKLSETPKSLFIDNTATVIKKKERLFQNINNLTVVGCSKWITDLAKESYVFKNKTIKHIYNGVDTNIFYNRDRNKCKKLINANADFVIMGMAGKWLDSRNSLLLKGVISKLGNSDLLMLIGCNNKQIENLKQYKNVKCVGFISDRNALAEYYCAADVFVNPTFEDTLPTVNIESLCCGTPVVTYDVCGSGEIIHVGFGVKVQVNNWEGIIESIFYIKSNKYRVDFTVIENIYDKKIAYAQYIELFNEIINKK